MTAKVSETLEKMWKEQKDLVNKIKKLSIKTKLLNESYKRDKTAILNYSIEEAVIEMATLLDELTALESNIKIRENEEF